MEILAVLYLSAIGLVVFTIFALYCVTCQAHGAVDGRWRRKLGPLPSTNIGIRIYERAYNNQTKAEDERQRNIEEYRRLEREGLLNRTLR